MKKIFFSLLILFAVALTSSASELLNIPYKNIKEEDKIKLNNDVWTNKISRRGCQYEFLYKGDLIGYSNQDLKFYDFTYADGLLNRRELSVDEIASMFPDFKIIKISEFSTNTNSLKVKKEGHNFKIILLNDTDRNFYHYSFSSGNGKFENYPLTGLINITKKGMFQFSHFGDNTKNNPWFILLVR